MDDLHVNGELTLGENIGDLAGLTMAYYALQTALENNNPGEIDGFTPEQRFFLSLGARPGGRNYPAGGPQAAGQHRPPFARQVPGQRPARQHARVRGGLRL